VGRTETARPETPEPVQDRAGQDRTVEAWLASAAHAHAGDLAPGAIAELLRNLAAHPGLAAHTPPRPAVGARSWTCLHRDAHIDVWVIAWTAGADTGWHDHDSSCGAFHVLAGTVAQDRPRWSGTHAREEVPAGEGRSFGPDHVHRMVSAGPAMTVHAYSPPLVRMGQYRLDSTGAMERRAVSYEEGLRPLAS
jgi:quercetin dioxygenase-like cupin family protein